MKATVELRDKREARLRQRLKDTPLRPLPLFQLTGWNHFVDEKVEPPTRAGSSPGPDRRKDEQSIAYHRHLRMVPTDAMTHMQETVVEAVHLNSGRREGLMDHVIDGPAGTGKTCLLRAAGRAAQQEIEAGTGGRRQNTIPVVHITTPADPEQKVNWVWEIASYLGLQPEPKSLAEVLEMRRHQDLTLPVNYVLETAQTRLLLIDDINRDMSAVRGDGLDVLPLAHQQVLGQPATVGIDRARRPPDIHPDRQPGRRPLVPTEHRPLRRQRAVVPLKRSPKSVVAPGDHDHPG